MDLLEVLKKNQIKLLEEIQEVNSLLVLDSGDGRMKVKLINLKKLLSENDTEIAEIEPTLSLNTRHLSVDKLITKGDLQDAITGLHRRFDDVDSILEKHTTSLFNILKISVEQKEELNELISQAETQGIDELSFMKKLDEIINLMNEHRNSLPNEIVQAWDESRKLQTSTGLTGKLKLSIPFIPGILSYDIETPKNLKDTFAQIWRDFKNKEYFLKNKS
jgi:hypothetical protein